ncbi:MAG: hypothetical protein ACYCSW_05340 [bacterium]
MKKIKFSDDRTSGFNINNIKNSIFVSSFGYSHVFNYPIILTDEVDKISKKIDKDKINVYFDLSSALGKESSNKYFLIPYDKNKKDFDYSSKKTLLELFNANDDDESNEPDESDDADSTIMVRKKRGHRIPLNTNYVGYRKLNRRKTHAS